MKGLNLAAEDIGVERQQAGMTDLTYHGCICLELL